MTKVEKNRVIRIDNINMENKIQWINPKHHLMGRWPIITLFTHRRITKPPYMDIHRNSDEQDGYHASHVTHVRQMAIMHAMHPHIIICMREPIKRGK